jgi:hypothetical protein
VRRGAAWPTERPSSCLVVREQEHGWAFQYVVARRGGPRGPDAGCAVVALSASVSGESVQCPTGGCPTVRCPVRVSERPGVQCPASGVRCGRPVSVPSSVCCGRPEWSWCVAVGQAVVRLGWPGVGMVARRVRNGTSARGGPWRSRLAQAVLGQRRVGSTGSSSWAVVGQWPLRPRGRPGEAGCARIARRSAAGGDHARWSVCEAWGRVAWSRRACPAAL